MTMSSGCTRCSAKAETQRQIERRQRAFTDNHRMDELHGNVLGVGRVWAASESQQPAPAQKTLGHFAACFSQSARLPSRKTIPESRLRASKRCST